MTKFLPTELVHTDVLTLGQTATPGDGGPKLDSRRGKLRLKENAETDRLYIESCFGRSLYSPEQLAAAEQALCTGNHLGCHLWFTAGAPDPEHARPRSPPSGSGGCLQCKRQPGRLCQGQRHYQSPFYD